LKELYNVNEEWFDKIAERLIASGHKPASTTAELEEYSMLLEDPAHKYLEAEEMIENVIEDFRSTRGLTIRAIHLAREEGDDVL
jgi:starvation-inducible DNA-binding protein